MVLVAQLFCNGAFHRVQDVSLMVFVGITLELERGMQHFDKNIVFCCTVHMIT